MLSVIGIYLDAQWSSPVYFGCMFQITCHNISRYGNYLRFFYCVVVCAPTLLAARWLIDCDAEMVDCSRCTVHTVQSVSACSTRAFCCCCSQFLFVGSDDDTEHEACEAIVMYNPQPVMDSQCVCILCVYGHEPTLWLNACDSIHSVHDMAMFVVTDRLTA